MAYTLIKGNLITKFKEGHFDVLVHGCNCYNIMGAGFAKQVKNNFPEAFQVDKEYSLSKGSHRLGNYSITMTSEDNYIVNAYTQVNTGKCFDITAFKLIMKKLEKKFYKCKIAVPGLIGCGIGGGNPEEVLKILEETFKDNDLYIVYPD